MSTFSKAPKEIELLASEILCEFKPHKPLLDARVKIDLVFAAGKRNEDGLLTAFAIKRNGVRAIGLARKLGLKERVMGRGDCEVLLDHDWWQDATLPQRRAVLDHELHHLTVKTDKNGLYQYDDIHRPLIVLRKHDYEFGWFSVIAQRHGAASIEVFQAKQILDGDGQLFFPSLFTENP